MDTLFWTLVTCLASSAFSIQVLKPTEAKCNGIDCKKQLFDNNPNTFIVSDSSWGAEGGIIVLEFSFAEEQELQGFDVFSETFFSGNTAEIKAVAVSNSKLQKDQIYSKKIAIKSYNSINNFWIRSSLVELKTAKFLYVVVKDLTIDKFVIYNTVEDQLGKPYQLITTEESLHPKEYTKGSLIKKNKGAFTSSDPSKRVVADILLDRFSVVKKIILILNDTKNIGESSNFPDVYIKADRNYFLGYETREDYCECLGSWQPANPDDYSKMEIYCGEACAGLSVLLFRSLLPSAVGFSEINVMGWFGNTSCNTDVNECAGTTNCAPEAKCEDHLNGYSCLCRPGYIDSATNGIPGSKCKNINECNDTNTYECQLNSQCKDTIGSYFCQCNLGYTEAYADDDYDEENPICSDINECKETNANAAQCSASSKCQNTEGSYECICNAGYRKDPNNIFSCIDIDECEENTDLCSQEANCINQQPFYACQCKDGYQFDPKDERKHTCIDVNECLSDYFCGFNTNCTNKKGSFNCECLPGFLDKSQQQSKRNLICEDIDECCSDEQLCPNNSLCTNTKGSFQCNCAPGFKDTTDNLGKALCEDIDECLDDSTNVCGDSDWKCANIAGGYVCKDGDGVVQKTVQAEGSTGSSSQATEAEGKSQAASEEQSGGETSNQSTPAPEEDAA